MANTTTDDDIRLAEPYPGLPSFVRQIREMSPDGQVADCFDHWSPGETTGHGTLDIELGRQHCLSAMAYSRQIGSATFLLYVIMAMQGRPVGDIERGFIAELVSPALRGRIPPIVPETAMPELAAMGVDIAVFRETEAFMATALEGSGAMPDLFLNYVLELISNPRDSWIGGAIYLLVGTALNGGLH
jgi:hypothetical protein